MSGSTARSQNSKRLKRWLKPRGRRAAKAIATSMHSRRFPVEELTKVLRLHDPRVPWLGFFGACFGAALALAMQAFTNWDYPINVGGRPLYPWSAFAVVTFELTVLFGALTAAFGMLALNDLPRLQRPGVLGGAVSSRLQGSLLPVHQGAAMRNSTQKATPHFLQRLGASSVEVLPL